MKKVLEILKAKCYYSTSVVHKIEESEENAGYNQGLMSLFNILLFLKKGRTWTICLA